MGIGLICFGKKEKENNGYAQFVQKREAIGGIKLIKRKGINAREKND